jgi:hypothetical protein
MAKLAAEDADRLSADTDSLLVCPRHTPVARAACLGLE